MARNRGNVSSFPALASAPSAPEEGDVYYNITDDTAYVFNGTSWVALIGGGGDTELTTRDFDTGAGVDTQAVVGLVVPASGGAVTIPGDATNGLDVDVTRVPVDPFGANADAAATTDAAASISAKLRGLVRWAYERMPASLGAKTQANSFPVTLATDEDILPRLGATNESAPATDTGTSGHSGRLQRIAQRLTTLIGLLPTSLGTKTSANSLAVTLASDESDVPTRPSRGPMTNRSGTIATGGASQVVCASNAARRYFFFQNVSADKLWIREGSGANENQPSIMVPPNGGAFVQEGSFVSTQEWNVRGPATGQAFSCREA